MLLEEGDRRAYTTLAFLQRSGLLEQDVAISQRQLVSKEPEPAICVDLSLQSLRKANDYATLLDYYLRQQDLDEMLCLMGKYASCMKGDLNTWLLNALKLAVLLYEEKGETRYLFSVYHFVRHYSPVRCGAIA